MLLLGYEGARLAEMIACTVKFALTEFGNSAVISHFSLSFPSHLVGSFACGFQTLVFSIARSVALHLAETSPRLELFQNVSHCLTQLVPLARARLLDDSVQLEILRLALAFLHRIASSPRTILGATGSSSSSGDVQTLLKDFTATSRFFAIACVYAASSDKQPHNAAALRRSVLFTVRRHMSLLLSPLLEDSTDLALQSRFALKRDPAAAETGEKRVGESRDGLISPHFG